MTLAEKARKMLLEDEGLRRTMYLDSLGVPTIGIGHNLRVPISTDAVNQIFKDDLNAALISARRVFQDSWFNLPEHAQLAVLNMLFQLGERGFRGFVRTIDLIRAGDYSAAADNALKSLWAKQTPARAERVARLLRGEAVYD